MPTFNDYGIVLSSYNLAEEDKILNIYTKENGLVRAVAKGTRKVTSRFGSKVSQLSCCYFQFASGKNLNTVCDLEQLNSFSKLRSDLSLLTYAILILEVVSNFAHEMESESSHTYDLLYSTLDKLQYSQDDIELLLVKFLLEFLSIHGLEPQLNTCVSCSEIVSKELDIYPYSSILGGILCRACSKLVENKPVSSEVLKVISLSCRDVACNVSTKENVQKALRLLKEHVDIRGKNKIKSFDLVFSL